MFAESWSEREKEGENVFKYDPCSIFLLYHPDGGEAEGERTHGWPSDSACAPDTITPLLTGYTPMENQKFLKNKKNKINMAQCNWWVDVWDFTVLVF